MRGVFYILSALVVIGLAFWAYQENYKTQSSIKRVIKLQQAIGDTREALSVQRAEWAYLNRPERLRKLVELNDADLLLMPLSADHFGLVEEFDFRSEGAVEISAPIEVQGRIGEASQ